MVRNLGLIFKKVPNGFPVPGQDLTIEDLPIDLSSAAAPEGGLLLRTSAISYDPYQRGRMRDSSVKSYSPAYPLNEPITNSAVGVVVKSGSDKFQEGDTVVVIGACPVQEYAAVSKEIIARGPGAVRKLENPYGLDEKLFIGALGMPGLTAYSRYVGALFKPVHQWS